MTNKEYIEACARTKSDKDFTIARDLLHAAMGITTECGELVDILKRTIFYGKELDTINLKEEVGDCLWYISILLNYMGWTYEEIMLLNIEKLKARYPEKFTQEKALERNLPLERMILEVGKGGK